MPFPNEHAARQLSPSEFVNFKRSKLNLPKGISAIIGIRRNGKTSIQSLRFDRKIWSASEAKRWLQKHGYKATVEAAIAKYVNWNGII